jgi:hypothetical protein
MLVGLVSLVGLHQLVSSNALAVNFTTTDSDFKIYTNYVQGVYGAGFLAQNNGATTQTLAGVGEASLIVTGGAPVRNTFDDAGLITIDGLGNPILFDANGLLTGSSDADAVDVSDMYLATDKVRAFGNNFKGLNLGQTPEQSAAGAGLSWGTNQGGDAPVPGNVGLLAERMNLSGLDGSTYGIELAGGLSMPGLDIRAVPGAATQADCTPGGT